MFIIFENGSLEMPKQNLIINFNYKGNIYSYSSGRQMTVFSTFKLFDSSKLGCIFHINPPLTYFIYQNKLTAAENMLVMAF